MVPRAVGVGYPIGGAGPVCAAGRGGVRCAVGITFVGEASRSPRTWAKHHGKFTKTAQSAERMLCMLECISAAVAGYG
jgi:hypothetical protein